MRRFSGTRRGGAGALGALLLGLAAALPSAGEARAAGRALLAPTPLILKDGRIANVSVHILEFRRGAERLGAEAATELRDLTRQAATDCFLTAQVIGHVGLAEVTSNDMLEAHRLARARADSVQAGLIGGGLPANAIASVWDWQFMVREPRATIWLFRLTRGEDCEGTPLEGAKPALVAEADADSAGTETAAPPETEQADPESTRRAARAVADGEAAQPAGPQEAERAPRPEPTRTAKSSERSDTAGAETAIARSSRPARPESRPEATQADAEASARAAPASDQKTTLAAADGEVSEAKPERPDTPEPAAQDAPNAPARARSEAKPGPSEAVATASRPGAARAGSASKTASKEAPAEKDEPSATDREERPGPDTSPAETGLLAEDGGAQPDDERAPDRKRTAAQSDDGSDGRASAAATTEPEPARPAPRETEPRPAAEDDRRQLSAEATDGSTRRTPDGVPTVVQPLPALSPEPSGSSRTESVEARPAHHQSQASVVAAAEAAEPPASAQDSGEVSGPTLVITFANNSSYFPPGTSRKLRALIRELDPGQSYRVRLSGAVSGSEKVDGASTPAEARRYNKWLAERRVGRVESWLAENVTDRNLAVASEFVAEDNSRQVRIRIAPAA